MKSRLIVDDVTSEPHPFVFRGKEYDLQKTFAVVKAVREFEIEDDTDYLDITYVALAAMMNDDLIRKGDTSDPVTVDMLHAWIPADQFSEIQDYVREIISPKKSDDEEVDASDLDQIIEDELPDDLKN